MSTLENNSLSVGDASALMSAVADRLTEIRLICNGDVSPRFLFDNPGEIALISGEERNLRKIIDSLDIACRRDIEQSGIFAVQANRVLVEIRRDGWLSIEGIGITGEKTGAKRRLRYAVPYSDRLTPSNWQAIECGFVRAQNIRKVFQAQSSQIEKIDWHRVAWRGAVPDGLLAHAKALPVDVISPAMIHAHEARAAAIRMHGKIRLLQIGVENMTKAASEFSSEIDPFLGEAGEFARLLA